jgi:hypothetical protein
MTVIICPSGPTYLSEDCDYNVKVDQHVCPRTVIIMSNWSDLSASGPLLLCASGAICLLGDCYFNVRVGGMSAWGLLL